MMEKSYYVDLKKDEPGLVCGRYFNLCVMFNMQIFEKTLMEILEYRPLDIRDHIGISPGPSGGRMYENDCGVF
jgi:hypothetical protein